MSGSQSCQNKNHTKYRCRKPFHLVPPGMNYIHQTGSQIDHCVGGPVQVEFPNRALQISGSTAFAVMPWPALNGWKPPAVFLVPNWSLLLAPPNTPRK